MSITGLVFLTLFVLAVIYGLAKGVHDHKKRVEAFIDEYGIAPGYAWLAVVSQNPRPETAEWAQGLRKHNLL